MVSFYFASIGSAVSSAGCAASSVVDGMVDYGGHDGIRVWYFIFFGFRTSMAAAPVPSAVL